MSRKADALLTALVANRQGEIFELNGYAATGMAGRRLVPLALDDTVKLPHGSELMYLPDRIPILYNRHTGRFERLASDPLRPEELLYPVAAFNSPGYLVNLISAYAERSKARILPLFSYGAVGWAGGFRSAVFRVDRSRRQDLRLMPPEGVIAGIRDQRRQLPANRLRHHLESCALTYGCPAAKNFFLGRCEAPLPTAQHCNARCRGCLSLQKAGDIPRSQGRIGFRPTPDEIAEVALAHIRKVRRAVVSFGQGCEGDPLLAVDTILPAIRLIRQKTRRGTININTNGSRPSVLQHLLDAGIDSMRISLNSFREECYTAYFRPRGYRFSDVCQGIRMALGKKIFVSLNYLNIPGFTDTPGEFRALEDFLRHYPLHMIQWRNLNFDPLRYRRLMEKHVQPETPMGMKALLEKIRRCFPRLGHGYFNPPKERFSP